MSPDFRHGERRKHQRYKVKELAIAVPNKPSSEIARIVNISKGGMAVRYLDQSNWLGNAADVDILVNSDFLMANIPIENIFDFKVENHLSFSIITERQCCLQFGQLPADKEAMLEEFIAKYTAGTA
jgi:hypothetical protein